ncbi:hypothetical protein, partial [Pseudomonas viridiflava]|uniref:hypothetical protein n=1 Tax=Pseudomonas viridiflava TaxID=33069 RepID=UPI00197CF822
VLYGLKATAKALRARANMIRSEKDWYSYCLQRVSLSGKFAEKPAKVAINAGMNLVPIKYNTGEVIRRVLEQLPASAPNEIRPKLASFAEWIARQKLTQAQQLRSFSPEALQKSIVQYVSVQATPHPVHGGPMVPA